MGAGRIFRQGASLVNQAIETRRLFDGPVWRKLVGTEAAPGFALKGKRAAFSGALVRWKCAQPH
jgi:hypothetical protein